MLHECDALVQLISLLFDLFKDEQTSVEEPVDTVFQT